MAGEIPIGFSTVVVPRTVAPEQKLGYRQVFRGGEKPREEKTGMLLRFEILKVFQGLFEFIIPMMTTANPTVSRSSTHAMPSMYSVAGRRPEQDDYG